MRPFQISIDIPYIYSMEKNQSNKTSALRLMDVTQAMPESLIKGLLETSECNGHGNWYGYSSSHTSLETPGDLQDIHKLVGNHHSKCLKSETNTLRDALGVYEFIKGCYGIMPPMMMMEVESELLQRFRGDYPNLFNTMIIWTWG